MACSRWEGSWAHATYVYTTVDFTKLPLRGSSFDSFDGCGDFHTKGWLTSPMRDPCAYHTEGASDSITPSTTYGPENQMEAGTHRTVLAQLCSQTFPEHYIVAIPINTAPRAGDCTCSLVACLTPKSRISYQRAFRLRSSSLRCLHAARCAARPAYLVVVGGQEKRKRSKVRTSTVAGHGK